MELEPELRLLCADFMSSPTVAVLGSTYSNTQLWAQGSYHPTRWAGLQYQLFRSAPNRRPFVVSDAGVEDTIGLGYDATRTDAQIRLSLRKETGALGSRADLIYARTGWEGGGVQQQINQIGGHVSYRAAAFSLAGSAFHRTRWTPLDVRVSGGINPIGPFSASAELVHLTHFGGRASDYESLSEATVKLGVKGERVIATAEGNGPVNALDRALRSSMENVYTALAGLELTDYKVRILEGSSGTNAITRILVTFSDGGEEWTTVGVGPNVVDASWVALEQAITYGLLRQGYPQD
jgi:hypothetical protein